MVPNKPGRKPWLIDRLFTEHLRLQALPKSKGWVAAPVLSWDQLAIPWDPIGVPDFDNSQINASVTILFAIVCYSYRFTSIMRLWKCNIQYRPMLHQTSSRNIEGVHVLLAVMVTNNFEA